MGGLSPATLVIKHALLATPSQRGRAVRLGVAVQDALLRNMGSEMVSTWGPERTARVGPIKESLSDGAILAAGTDIVRPLNPMTSVWGMVTRGTRSAGVQGPEHAIERQIAVELCTTAGACLYREEDRRGTVTPGRLADLVAYRAHPFEVGLHELADLTPVFPMVGGRPVHDPDGRLS